MADVQFWDLEERLVATVGDGAAVWDGGGWKVTTPAHACKAQVDGEELTAGQASSRFPSADISSVPVKELEQADAAAVAGQTDTDESELDEIEAQLNAE
jgi:hypothetical protein